MPDAVTHPTLHELIAFGLGKLSESAVATVAVHLESCSACRQAVASVAPDSFLGKVRAAGPNVSSFPPGLAKPGNAPSSDSRPAIALNPCPDLPPELARHPKYLILRELGRGGMGVVYQARHKEMDRQVVIKVINRALLERPGALERFHREVKAAALLSHPNIVTAYDAERIGDAHMLVMEFVPGQNLAEVVQKRGPLPIEFACHFARQVALGLQHAHERGLVHRDIKPQNLMLALKNQVKILDFGLAKVVREEVEGTGLTAHDSCMGTPEYCAPEQALNARDADIRADLYSLGCTLYYLLSGCPPFREDTVVNTFLAHQQKQARPLPELRAEVPAELWQVVERLLAKEPGQRYQKPLEVVQALGPFVKSGGKPEGKSGSGPVAGSPEKGTMIAADTRQIQKVLREVPGKTPRKEVPATLMESSFEDLVDTSALPKKAKGAREARKRAPAGWYRRWPVLAGMGVLLLALLGVWASGVFKVKTKDGTLVLQNLPADAEVLVDDGTVKVKWSDGKTAEVSVAPGKKHRIQVKKEGFKVFGEEVEVDAGGSTPLLVRLEKPVARIVLQNLPADAEVFVDGAKAIVNRGDGGKTAPINVVSGRHKIVATKDGINVLGEEVEIKGGELRVLTVTLRMDKGEEKWIQEVAAQPAESQVKAVADKLKERNPGFDGAVKPTIENGNVTGLELVTDHVTDLSPLRALPGMKFLSCRGSGHDKGEIADLSPLKGMHLTRLDFWGTPVSDLSPLKGMSLTFLGCAATKVSDLSPLKGMPLTTLWCNNTRVSDLSPLKGMQLTSLIFFDTAVSDLSPLKGMPLQCLRCANTRVSDLSPLKGMPLTDLWCESNARVTDLSLLKDMPLKTLVCDFRPERDMEILRSIKTLETINGKPVAQFRKEVDGKKTSGGSPTKEKGPSREEGFKSLFNGKDLTGWKTHPDAPGDWKVENGILIGRGQNSHLYSQRGDYVDFYLLVEAKINQGGSSAVLFHKGFPPSRAFGYKALIDSSGLNKFKTGTLWVKTPLRVGIEKVLVPDDTWFTQAVIIQGNHIIIKINGIKTVDFVDVENTWPAGHIALRVFGRPTVVQFRRIEIKELPAAKADTPSPAKPKAPPAPREVKASDYDLTGGYRFVHFGKDQTRVVLRFNDDKQKSYFARVYDLSTGKPITPPLNHARFVSHASFSPDGQHVVTASYDHTARLWDATTGKEVTPPLKHESGVEHASFSPDGQRVVSGGKTARVWDAATGRALTPPLKHAHTVYHASFSPDGKRVVTASFDKTARVWDAAIGRALTPPLKHKAFVFHASFSPDGRRVVTASGDSTAQLWDAATGEEVTPPLKHDSFVITRCASFSPDGKRVVTASADKTARVWDAATGTQITPSLKHEHIVFRSFFSPDGQRVVTASLDKTARVWDAATGMEVTPPLRHGGWVLHASFSPNGQHVVTASEDNTALLWDAATGRELKKVTIAPK